MIKGGKFMKIKEFFIKLFKSKRFYFFLAITALVVLLFYRNFPRFFISIKSFWHHLIYFVSYDFITDKTPPIQSFQYIIDEDLFNLFLPVEWDVFKERFALSFELLIQPQIIQNYLSTLGNILYQASRLIISLGLVVFVFFLIFKAQKFQEKSMPIDSKPLKFYKKKCLKKIMPIKKAIIAFFKEVFDSSFIQTYCIILLLFATNLAPIIIDTISEILLICSGGHFHLLFPYLMMALMDITRFFIANPLIIVIPTTIWIFDRIRVHNGLRVLKKHDKSNKEFYEKTGNIILFTGASGTGKTTMLIDAAITIENSIRNDKLLKILHRQSAKFPNFPWRKLESEIDRLSNNGVIKTRVDIADYINHLYCDYKHNGMIFDYDDKIYPMKNWDELTVDSIFEAMNKYAVAYFFYRIEKPLSISSTGIYHDIGVNEPKHWFPLYSPNYFTETMDEFLKRKKGYYSAIIDYNHMRLGMKKVSTDENGKTINPDAYLYNIGVIAMPECDKERGSYADIRSQDEDEEVCNQVNDLFYSYQTIMRHNTELDHEVLHKIVMDDQDLMKLNPELRQLVETVITLDRNQRKPGNALLFWWITETICEPIVKLYNSLNDSRKQFKQHDTLTMYFLRNILSKIDTYYTRRFNKFGYDKLGLFTTNSSLDDVTEESDKDCLYLSYKKLYSDRFDDVYLKSLFLAIEKNATLSIDDLKRFESTTPTVSDFAKQNSFLYDDYFSIFNSGRR